LLEREKVLRQTINAKDSQRLIYLQNKQTEKALGFEKELGELLKQYDLVQAEIRKQSPQFAALVQPQTVSLATTQSELLDEDTVLLEYVLGEEKSFLFFVTKSKLEVISLPKNAQIEKVVRQFISAIKAFEVFVPNESPAQREARLKSAESIWKEQGRVLSEILFSKIGDKLKNKRLLIVTPGVLQYVPFATLYTPSVKDAATDKFLIETNEIVSLPSATVLSVLRKNKKKQNDAGEKSIAILADPVFSQTDVRLKQLSATAKPNSDQPESKPENATRQLGSDLARLRFSRREAQAIESFIPAEQRFIALDFAANTSVITDMKFREADIIHLATHGIINSEFPELSSIVLSMVDKNGKQQNGYLRLNDIYNLRLNADLVVLSACDSGLGKEIRGEGIVGLTRGFMYAGSNSVIASLWKVEDRATAELMKRFYRAMLKDGQKPVSALRTAQIEMLRERRWQNPFYWAAFTLQGEWE
jgi:CHAT domain-containing protein